MPTSNGLPAVSRKSTSNGVPASNGHPPVILVDEADSRQGNPVLSSEHPAHGWPAPTDQAGQPLPLIANLPPQYGAEPPTVPKRMESQFQSSQASIEMLETLANLENYLSRESGDLEVSFSTPTSTGSGSDALCATGQESGGNGEQGRVAHGSELDTGLGMNDTASRHTNPGYFSLQDFENAQESNI